MKILFDKEHELGVARATTMALMAPIHPRVGCALVNRHGVIVASHNIPKSHPQQAAWANKYGRPQQINLHAEIRTLIDMLRAYGPSVGEVTAYVVRLGKGGEYRASHPCGVCTGALIECGVKEVVYYDDDAGKFIPRPLT